jgi:hypothetical protein
VDPTGADRDHKALTAVAGEDRGGPRGERWPARTGAAGGARPVAGEDRGGTRPATGVDRGDAHPAACESGHGRVVWRARHGL